MYQTLQALGLLVLISFVSLFTPVNVFASFSFNISSPSATLITTGSQEVSVSLNVTDLPSESYFRVALQKDTGTGLYYGYVQNNNNEWSKILVLSGDCLGYFKITDLTTKLLNLNFKIGDDSEIGSWNYILKAHRFTKTCNSYTESQNTIPIVISLPTPDPTQTPTANPTATQTSNPTLIATPTIKPTPTKTSTPKPTPTETPEAEETELPFFDMTNDNKPTSTPAPIVMGAKTENKSGLISFIFISIGFLFLGYGGYMIYNKRHEFFAQKRDI